MNWPYQAKVTNEGTGKSGKSVVRMAIPEYTTAISHSCSTGGGTYLTFVAGRETLVCELDEIPAGGTVTINLTVNVKPMAKIGSRKIRNKATLIFGIIPEKKMARAEDDEAQELRSNELVHTQRNAANTGDDSADIEVPKMGDET